MVKQSISSPQDPQADPSLLSCRTGKSDPLKGLTDSQVAELAGVQCSTHQALLAISTR